MKIIVLSFLWMLPDGDRVYWELHAPDLATCQAARSELINQIEADPEPMEGSFWIECTEGYEI